MHILLLGKNGMLGRTIEEKLEIRQPEVGPPLAEISPACPVGRNFEFISWGRDDLDITDKKSVQEKIIALNPAVVINATGYTNVDGAETEKEKAFSVNAEGVGNIVEACTKCGAMLFHFSTDYVFDGTQENGYREDDSEHVAPLNIYGASKLAGEENVKCQMSPLRQGFEGQANVKCFLIRTSWLYGRGGKNFVDTLITRAQAGQTEFKVVNDQFGKPTYTHDLADTVLWMIENEEKLNSGIYHATNETKNSRGISWYEFAQEIFACANKLGVISHKPKVVPCTTAEFSRPARRPTYSALTNTCLSPLRAWHQALHEYLRTTYSL